MENTNSKGIAVAASTTSDVSSEEVNLVVPTAQEERPTCSTSSFADHEVTPNSNKTTNATSTVSEIVSPGAQEGQSSHSASSFKADAGDSLPCTSSSSQMIDLISNTIEGLGVLHTINLEDIQSDTLCDPSRKPIYTFSRRITVNELILKYAKTVKAAQNTYLNEVKQASAELYNNYLYCQKMDDVLGTKEGTTCVSDKEADAYTDSVSSYGAVKYKCPMHECTTNTYQLKRHLVNVHKLSKEKLSFALEAAAKFVKHPPLSESGKTISHSSTPTTTRLSTKLVSRKLNFKICVLCDNLFINMSDHIRNKHRIELSHPKYNHYVRDCEVVPKCYTEKVDGKIVMLTGDKMEEAKEKFEEDIQRQNKHLDKLKEQRNIIHSLQEDISKEPSSQKEKELHTARERYNQERFKDHRNYSENLKIWKDSFEEHLIMRGDSCPQRSVKMAMDILVGYEEQANRNLTFTDILDGRTIRSILEIFKKNLSTNSTSKIKYITQFQLLICFLISDVSSPEYKPNLTVQEKLSRDSDRRTIMHEIKNVKTQLSKRRGLDVIAAKVKAKNKLISKDDNLAMLREAQDSLYEFMAMSNDRTSEFSRNEALNVRNTLMAIGTLRLGRRSKELITMTLEEVAAAEKQSISGENYYFVKVANQKGARSGESATVPFHQKEYDALHLYLDKLRPLIGNTATNSVFICSSGPLSFALVYKILQKYTTPSGKKISSRSVRGSIVTNSRRDNLSQSQKVDLAKSMNHDIATAERHYNYHDISDSVRNVLSTSHSTPVKYNSDLPSPPSVSPLPQRKPSSPSPVSSSSSSNESPRPSTSGVKRPLAFLQDDTSNDEDRTLLTLRAKKIKPRPMMVKKLKEEIKRIVSLAKATDTLGRFYTQLGTASIAPVRLEICDKDLLTHVSVSQVRKFMLEAIAALDPSS